MMQDKGIRYLYKDKVKGLLNDTDFTTLSDAFQAERTQLENLVAAAKIELQELDHRLQNGDDRRSITEQYTNVEHLTREMVEMLVDHIVIHRQNPETKRIPIEIYRSF